jgi:hypothetical protein
MTSLVLAVLQLVVAISMLGCIVYAFTKRSASKPGLPHPSLALVFAFMALSGLINTLRYSTAALQNGTNMAGFYAALATTVFSVFAIVHIYSRAWSALQSTADRKNNA